MLTLREGSALVKGGKRGREESSFTDNTIALYINSILKSLTQLFTNDSEREFMDGAKFDLLSERLSNLFII